MAGLFKRCAESYGACDVAELLAGNGLFVPEGTCSLAVTTEGINPDPSKTITFTVMQDSNLSISAKTITITKTYVTYSVLRSYWGQFLDVQAGNSFTKEETITLPDSYGYGNVSMQSVQERESTPKKPNFYQKGIK